MRTKVGLIEVSRTACQHALAVNACTAWPVSFCYRWRLDKVQPTKAAAKANRLCGMQCVIGQHWWDHHAFHTIPAQSWRVRFPAPHSRLKRCLQTRYARNLLKRPSTQVVHAQTLDDFNNAVSGIKDHFDEQCGRRNCLNATRVRVDGGTWSHIH